MKFKNLLIAFLSLVFFIGFAYIIGSLCAADFNIKNWNGTLRGFTFLFSGFISIVIGYAVFIILTDFDEDKK